MSDNFILFGGRRVPIHTDKPVMLYNVDGNRSFYKPAMVLSDDQLMRMATLRPTMKNYSYRRSGGTWFTKEPEQFFSVTRSELDALGQGIYQIALHHDVTLNAIDTFNVLCTRGLSTHFVINHDGTLFQMLDCYHTAWATGDNNNQCIAIDVNNPVYLESRAQDPAGGQRDVYQGKINGSLKTMLGYTDAQYDTLIALMKAFTSPIPVQDEEPWIPLPIVAQHCFPPVNESGEVINRLIANHLSFQGFLGHYHCSSNKWDPGPAMDWFRVLSGIKGKRNSLPLLLEPDKRNISEVAGLELENLFERYFRNAEVSEGGWYPVGVNQSWHSGCHLSAAEGTEIINMFEGEIVAARSCGTVELGDPSFVLVRHQMPYEDSEGKEAHQPWYTLYMHLSPLGEETIGKIKWASQVLDGEVKLPDDLRYQYDLDKFRYEKGVPKAVDATNIIQNKAEITRSFFKGDILLTQLKVEAGEVIGFMGKFGTSPDKLVPTLHVECFSEENLFQIRGNQNAQSEGWSIIEGDASNDSLVRVKKILNPIFQSRHNFARDAKFLLSSEIRQFYSSDSVEKESFRKMICYHRSEWSPTMNWTKTAVSALGWQWETEEAFGKWLLLWVPFQWLINAVTKHVGLSDKHTFFTYHPIHLLSQLNMTYSGYIGSNAQEASDDEFEENARQMKLRVDELAGLNQKLKDGTKLSEKEADRYRELYMLMDDHLDSGEADLDRETRYDYESHVSFEHWEAGEWPVPKDNKSQY